MTTTILSDRTKRILDNTKYNNACPLNPFAGAHHRNATVWYHTLDGTIYGVGSSYPKDENGNRFEDLECVTVPVDSMGLKAKISTSPDLEGIDGQMPEFIKRKIILQILAWRFSREK